jgi:glyoxylase-like metal-dependent hydrolase (beta-lactamase superfamily II)
MPEADDLQQLTASLWIWQAFDPAVKADLFSTAVLSGGRLFLIDPIGLAPEPRGELKRIAPIAGILLTNANHLRDAKEWAQREQAPVWAGESAGLKLDGPSAFRVFGDGIAPELTPITIDGAVAGETALFLAGDDGTVVVGDALINVEPYGFSLLPKKYCSDQEQLRRSLRQFLNFSIERLLFAHGYPLVDSTRERLEEVLQ